MNLKNKKFISSFGIEVMGKGGGAWIAMDNNHLLSFAMFTWQSLQKAMYFMAKLLKLSWSWYITKATDFKISWHFLLKVCSKKYYGFLPEFFFSYYFSWSNNNNLENVHTKQPKIRLVWTGGLSGRSGSRAVCRCRDGYVGDPFAECRLEPCATSPCGTNADCSSLGRSASKIIRK